MEENQTNHPTIEVNNNRMDDRQSELLIIQQANNNQPPAEPVDNGTGPDIEPAPLQFHIDEPDTPQHEPNVVPQLPIPVIPQELTIEDTRHDEPRRSARIPVYTEKYANYRRKLLDGFGTEDDSDFADAMTAGIEFFTHDHDLSKEYTPSSAQCSALR